MKCCCCLNHFEEGTGYSPSGTGPEIVCLQCWESMAKTDHGKFLQIAITLLSREKKDGGIGFREIFSES